MRGVDEQQLDAARRAPRGRARAPARAARGRCAGAGAGTPRGARARRGRTTSAAASARRAAARRPSSRSRCRARRRGGAPSRAAAARRRRRAASRTAAPSRRRAGRRAASRAPGTARRAAAGHAWRAAGARAGGATSRREAIVRGMSGPSTRSIHAGVPAGEQGEPLLPGPVLAAPYHLRGAKDAAPYGYGRDGNPSWTHLERALGELDGGESACCSPRAWRRSRRCSSARCAPATCSSPAATATRASAALAAERLAPLGVETRLVPTDTAAIAEARGGRGARVARDALEPARWTSSTSPPWPRPRTPRARCWRSTTRSARRSASGRWSSGADFAMLSRHQVRSAATPTCCSARSPSPTPSWRGRAAALAHPVGRDRRRRSRRGSRTARWPRSACAWSARARTRPRVAALLRDARRRRGGRATRAGRARARQMALRGPARRLLAGERRARAARSSPRCELVAEATSFGGVHSTAERRGRWGTDAVGRGLHPLLRGLRGRRRTCSPTSRAALDARPSHSGRHTATSGERIPVQRAPCLHSAAFSPLSSPRVTPGRGRTRPPRRLPSRTDGPRHHRPRLLRLRRRDAALARPVPGLRGVEHARRGGRARPRRRRPRRRAAAARGRARGQAGAARATSRRCATSRLQTGIGELDRVLGGGLVPGSLVLIGGSPGIGKSTLTSMALGNLAGRRAAHALRLRRGVRGADPPARRAAAGRGAGRADARRDRPRDRARDARRRAARGLRDRLGADAARRRPDRRGRLGRPGARGRRPHHAPGEGARHRGAARRPRHEGGLARRPARARAPRRLRAAVRGRARAHLPDAARAQEPLRLDQRGRRLRDAPGRPGRGRGRLGALRRRGHARARQRRARGDGGLAPAAGRGPGARVARPSSCRRGGSSTGSTATGSRSCSRCSAATPASPSAAPTCSSTSRAACGSTSPAPTSRSRWRWPAPPAALPLGGDSPKPVACFGEVGLTGELRSVGHADRRLAEARKFGLGPVIAPGGQRGRRHRGAHPARRAARGAAAAAARAGRLSRRARSSPKAVRQPREIPALEPKTRLKGA